MEEEMIEVLVTTTFSKHPKLGSMTLEWEGIIVFAVHISHIFLFLSI